jgi:hypothetical protein
MYTAQVGELSADLAELIRKHDGRDLTRTEIVRQLATEACVLMDPSNRDPKLLPLLRHLQLAVEITVDFPQTVDEVDKAEKPWRVKASARERLQRQLVVACDAALGRLDPDRVAVELVGQAQVALQPDDEPVRNALPARLRPHEAGRGGAAAGSRGSVMQLDLFRGTPAPQPPQEPATLQEEFLSIKGACCHLHAADADLDAAIEIMRPGYLYFVIQQVLSTGAAELLVELRQSGSIDRDRARSNDAYSELLKCGCITVRRNRKRLDVHLVRRRIVELSAETDRRLRRWVAGECGLPENAVYAWEAA